MKNKVPKISPEETEFLDIMIKSDMVYDAVIQQLDISEDPLFRSMVVGMLKRQTKDHLVFAIWNNLDDKQTSHLRDFIDQASVVTPWMKHEDLLMEFALLYPKLMESIYESLAQFFKKFIETFNELQK